MMDLLDKNIREIQSVFCLSIGIYIPTNKLEINRFTIFSFLYYLFMRIKIKHDCLR